MPSGFIVLTFRSSSYYSSYLPSSTVLDFRNPPRVPHTRFRRNSTSTLTPVFMHYSPASIVAITCYLLLNFETDHYILGYTVYCYAIIA